ncbi:ABC transporter permease [Piscibacillus sp. B03]|uniref:ABC transporter permease n=1 Tax=Piscibacillus sp. B03 TaxID=3457430 RepID=UPI003FCED793
MKAIFKLQWQRLKREPLLTGSMVLMTIVFIMVMGGFNATGQVTVPVYFQSDIDHPDKWVEELNESTEVFKFVKTNENAAIEGVALGEYYYAVKLMPGDYRILMMAENNQLYSLDQVLNQYISSKNLLSEVATQVEDPKPFVQKINEVEPILTVNRVIEGEEDSDGYNQQLQTLFGMTLFFSLYTIMFSLGKIALEKQTGTMNRIILSPIKKWQVYLGYMSFSYLLGFVQIVSVILLFKYLFGFEVGNHMPAIILTVACFVFAIVSLAMLVLGLVKNYQQLNAVIPIVTVSMAMIGGAFWPLDIVSNRFILAIAKIDPIAYAMEALQSITMFGHGITDIYDSLAILIFIGVLCIGIGINLMERRS